MTTTRNNYTPEQTQQLISLYEELGNDGLELIAEKCNRTVRSIRAKLVREGKYVAPNKVALRKTTGPSKKEQLRELETILPFNTEGFMGATKGVLNELLVYLKQNN